MDVNSTGAANGVQQVPRQQPVNNTSPAARQTSVFQPVNDELEISDVGRMLSEIQENEGSGETRQEKLQRIKAEIADGTYDTDEKMDIAMMRLFNEIAHEGE